uniref:Uncharacterized protein n=1 Tax=Oryza barthii TaxID=65489 RepID=A0A0D3FPJ1_9ORYZ
MSEDSPATSPSRLSHIALLQTPSMEEDEEEDGELLVVDMEMTGEDELLSLNGGGGGHEGQFCLITRWRSENDFENAQKGQKWQSGGEHTLHIGILAKRVFVMAL